MHAVLTSGAVSESTCRRWVTQFNNGDLNVEDLQRSGRPSMNIDDAILQQLDSEKYSTCRSIALELAISSETARNHFIRMGKRYLCNRWIPHLLSPEQMANRERIYSQMQKFVNACFYTAFCCCTACLCINC